MSDAQLYVTQQQAPAGLPWRWKWVVAVCAAACSRQERFRATHRGRPLVWDRRLGAQHGARSVVSFG